MTELEVLRHTLHERTERLHRCQGEHAVLSAHNSHNDPHALSLLTEVFANWGAWVEHGVFDDKLESQVRQFQDSWGVQPADGVVRRSTWAALGAALQAEVADLERNVAQAAGQGPHHAPADHPTWGSDDGTGHYQGPVVMNPAHPNADQLHQHIERANHLLHACADSSRPELAVHGHNDMQWVSVVVDCFRLFDLVNAFDTVNPGLGWGSGSMHDGEFDQSLQNAVHRYQEVNNLRPTGNVDAATWAALVEDLRGVVQSLRYRLAG
jgi:murein L,D-transpeptidase YcbB/YkuD